MPRRKLLLKDESKEGSKDKSTDGIRRLQDHSHEKRDESSSVRESQPVSFINCGLRPARNGGEEGEEMATQAFVAQHASDPELFVSLQFLFHSHSGRQDQHPGVDSIVWHIG